MKFPSCQSQEVPYVWHCGVISPSNVPVRGQGCRRKKVTYWIHAANTADLRHKPSLVIFWSLCIPHYILVPNVLATSNIFSISINKVCLQDFKLDIRVSKTSSMLKYHLYYSNLNENRGRGIILPWSLYLDHLRRKMIFIWLCTYKVSNVKCSA